jgi:hypothetical protein
MFKSFREFFKSMGFGVNHELTYIDKDESLSPEEKNERKSLVRYLLHRGFYSYPNRTVSDGYLVLKIKGKAMLSINYMSSNPYLVLSDGLRTVSVFSDYEHVVEAYKDQMALAKYWLRKR